MGHGGSFLGGKAPAGEAKRGRPAGASVRASACRRQACVQRVGLFVLRGHMSCELGCFELADRLEQPVAVRLAVVVTVVEQGLSRSPVGAVVGCLGHARM